VVTVPQVFHDRQRPEWEREADMARAREGCSRCSEIPAEVLGAVTAALREAKGRRPA
jgi:hypothetical protein